MQEHNIQERTYRRFSVLHRFIHLVVMIGFLGLAVTGFSLAFSECDLSQFFMWLVGGQANAAFLHHFFALITYLCVLIHVIYFIYYKLGLKQNFSHPQSILPQKYDLKHLKEHFLYFLARKETPPKFNRFTYLEKIDYWSFFIGMNTMGITGLLLLYPEFFTRFLPGYFINIARILHFYEAILAVTIKIVIHSIMVHLRPSVYPLDKSIFTEKIPIEHMQKEHPGEWEYLVEQQSSYAPENQ
jgi:cytochrome b subunit of formate dehydrogenase